MPTAAQNSSLGAMAPDLAEARGFFEEALGLARQAGDTSHERVILANLVNWPTPPSPPTPSATPPSPPAGGGAMVKGPRAQGEALAAFLEGSLHPGWRSRDGRILQAT